MITKPQLQQLLSKWTTESDSSRDEAQRLEKADQIRHSKTITILETKSQLLDRCVYELTALARLPDVD